LAVAPLAADHGEILVRSVTAGFLVSLISRVGWDARSRARWSLCLTEADLVPRGPGRDQS
jgi:hypothetical protein